MTSAAVDFTDRKILRALLSKGRSTFAELASQAGLTAPTVHDRVKKLERCGVIKGYAAIVDPTTLGYEITAMVSITTAADTPAKDYEARLAEISEIQECHAVAGDETYVARVMTKNPRTLEQLLHRIRSLPGTLRTKTSVVLSSPISRHSLPKEEELREFRGEKTALVR